MQRFLIANQLSNNFLKNAEVSMVTANEVMPSECSGFYGYFDEVLLPGKVAKSMTKL